MSLSVDWVFEFLLQSIRFPTESFDRLRFRVDLPIASVSEFVSRLIGWPTSLPTEWVSELLFCRSVFRVSLPIGRVSEVVF